MVRTPDEVSTNLTLSCTVSGRGKFSWAWTAAQSPVMVWISDFTRTSTAMFTGIRRLDSGENGYRCTATYDPMVTGPSFDMSVSQQFSVDLQCKQHISMKCMYLMQFTVEILIIICELSPIPICSFDIGECGAVVTSRTVTCCRFL